MENRSVLIVDNQSLIRAGIVKLIDSIAGFEVVADVDNAEAALMVSRTRHIDILVTDWVLSGLGGLEMLRRFMAQNPRSATLVLSAQFEDPFPTRLLQIGVRGLISKTAAVPELERALRSMARGERFICGHVAQRLVSTWPGVSDNPFDELSQRELQVMMMSLAGMRVHDISAKLCLSPKTISTYRYRSFEKLGVSGEIELTRLAIRYGVVEKRGLEMRDESALAASH
jgi:two-component system invasion response regulator UvrY